MIWFILVSRKSSQKFAKNMSNSIIGAGIVGIPFALQKSGIGVGLLLLVLMAKISHCSLGWLVEANIALRSRSLTFAS